MTNIRRNFLYVLLVVGAFVVLFLLSLFMLNPAIDTGRELFIPLRMLNGEVLYKDILNIYGSLAYQINEVAYWLTGARIFSLRIFGTVNLLLLFSAMWFILKELFPQKEAITVFSKISPIHKIFGLFLLLTVFPTGIFNYILPYSFAMTYGLCFFLFSLLFFIKFSKTDMPKYAYLSALFAGGAFCCKYDFLGYLIFLFLYILLSNKITTKDVLISVTLMVSLPLVSYGILFAQGMTFEDLSKTAQIVKTMAKTNANTYLYTHFAGTYFNWKIFTVCFGKTLLLAFIGCIIYFSRKLYKRDKILTLIVFLFSLLCVWYIGVVGFSLFAIINTILLFVYFKKIYNNKPVFVFMLSSVLLSLKTFFAINVDTYGVYTLPFLIISIFVFLANIDYSDNDDIKTNIANTYSVVAFLLVTVFVLNAGVQILKKTRAMIAVEPIKNRNFAEIISKTAYTYPSIAKPINSAIFYIENNTNPTDKIVVLPETQFLNFVTKHPADNLYSSLTPVYFETFGEYNIIEHFEQNKPEYFILNNRDTSDYGKRYICEDYGQAFCSFVKDNYKKVETFGEKRYILQVFKRKDLL